MCEPVSIGMAVASMAMSVSSMQAQQKAQRNTAKVNMKNAENAQIADLNAQREKSEQISGQAQDAKLQRQREALRERATMTVNNKGANGNTIDRLFNTSYFNENFDEGSINKNWENSQAQTTRETEKINVTAMGRIRNAQTDYANAGGSSRLLVSAVQGGLQGYSMGQSMSTGGGDKFYDQKIRRIKSENR
jgi:hypothetical protein